MAYTKEESRAYYKEYRTRPKAIARARAYYRKNKAKIRAYYKIYDKVNSEKIKVRKRGRYQENKPLHRSYQLKSKYGLTVDQFDALLAKQENRCGICSKHFTTITGDRKSNGQMKPVVDHDHANGRVRGLLCQRCNSGLGMFDDSVSTIVNAGCYLENPPNGR